MNRTVAGIICPEHGAVDLLECEYWEQIENAPAPWYCPICKSSAEFSSSRFMEIEGVSDEQLREAC